MRAPLAPVPASGLRPPALALAPALAIALALASAGCAALDEDESANGDDPQAERGGSCGADFAGPPGNNAPLHSALQDDPEVVAARFAEALGESLGGAPEVDAVALRWKTTNGTVEQRRGEDLVQLAYRPDDPTFLVDATAGRATLQRVLDAFFVPMNASDATFVEGRLDLPQTLEGARVAAPGEEHAEGATTGAFLVLGSGPLLFGPVYDLRAPPALVTAERAAEIASAYAACLARASTPVQAEGFTVADASLARVVLVGPPGGCEALRVLVDAQTEAVRGERPVPCAG